MSAGEHVLTLLMAAFPAALLFGVAGAVIGGQRNRGGLGFIYGALLGPIGLLLIWQERGDRAVCAACRSYISPAATVCPQCRNPQPERPRTCRCPACRREVILPPGSAGRLARCAECNQHFTVPA